LCAGPMAGMNASSDAIVRSKMMKNDDKGTSELYIQIIF
jgi:hypothetical protein